MICTATLLPVALALLPSQGAAQSSVPPRQAGIDFFYSADAEDSEVMKAGVDLDLRHDAPDEYLGLRLEKARFNPSGQGWQDADRVYVRAADRIGDWKWQARAGTDGDALLGAATIHNGARFRQEYFIEREIVETPQGLSRGIYSTFAGGALDLPADERNTFTLLAGLQEFTGRNVRTHLRANFIHVVKPEWGLSGQMRTRYFRSSEPGEFDYYSPRWNAQVLPVLQLRRFSKGWRYLAAAGLGTQRDSGTDWAPLRYARAQVTSPALESGWALEAGATYTNAPLNTGFGYSYLQLNLGVRRRF